MKIEGWRARLLVSFAYWVLRVWALTLRLKFEDRGNVAPATLKEPHIFVVWHNRLLLLPLVFRRFLPTFTGKVLISSSRDGDLIAAITKKFDYDAIRGSTSRRGAGALRELADVLASGMNLLITPDGPRGPVYELGQGVVFLAQKCSSTVVPVGLEFSRSWRVKSWDRFFLPQPFCTVRFILGVPLNIGETSAPEQFENERLRLQNAMMSLVEEK